MQSIARLLVSAGFLFSVASCSRVEPVSEVPATDALAATGTSSHADDQHTKHDQARGPAAQEQHSSPPNKDDPAFAIFEKRILPIFQSAKASSCTECHLSGVDLKDYIRPTQQETFAALKGAGLIDTGKPEASKLLAFIARKPDKPSLITDKVRKEEYEAFRAWIVAAVKDPALAK